MFFSFLLYVWITVYTGALLYIDLIELAVLPTLFIYALCVFEAFQARVYTILLNLKKIDDIMDYLNKYKQSSPKIYMVVQCYHYEGRVFSN